MTYSRELCYTPGKGVIKMAYSKAQMEANHRYRDKAYDRFEITVPKGQRDAYKAQAAAHGLSLNAYIISLLDADAATDKPATPEE